MLLLSPRAVERLESFVPPRPLPKLFRLVRGGKLNSAIFTGATINTPSMLCVEDYLDALAWTRKIGGLEELIRRSVDNLKAVAAWVARTPWIEFLARRAETRSNTSICLRFSAPEVTALDSAGQTAFAKRISALLEQEQVAFDLNAYRSAPPGLRIWGGATVNTEDIEALLPWIEWAHAVAIAEIGS
jgi:phosphoserine aminotransferase